MKRKIITVLLAFVMMLSLCSCMGAVADITVNKDGSGSVTASMGFTTEGVNQLIAAGVDVGDLQDFTYKGVTYHGETESADFSNVDEFNELYTGTFHITMHGDSMALVVAGVSDYVDDSVLSFTGGEEFDLSEMVMDVSFEFPYPVTQSCGHTTGIIIDKNHLTIDLMAMASDPSAVAFHIGEFGLFTDVGSNAWYATAIDYAACAGIVSGYGDGVFGPNDKLTISALCQIIYNISDILSSDNTSGYWAYPAIEFCLANGYVEDFGAITSANYDVPATREVAISALNRFLFGVKTYYDGEGSYNIPDYLDISEVYRNDIRGAYYNKLVSGVDGNGTFLPGNDITRAEFCQVYYNYHARSRYMTEVN